MERSNPTVTVIIPSYNREKYIRATVDSALAQTYQNIEIVVVDDGSTDCSREILESYGNRIRLLEHEGRANRGQSAAINLALRSSSGGYVAILDSDDVWTVGKIEKQVEYLERHPDIGIVYGNGYAIDENGKILYQLIPPGHREESDPSRMLMECHFNIPSNALVRRSAFKKAGEFDETLRSSQDHDMAIRLLEVTRAAFLDEPVWYYRQHPDTQSNKHTKRRWLNGFKILDKACRRYPYGWNVKRRRLAVLHFRLGQCLSSERAYLAAVKNFLLAGVYDPARAARVMLGTDRGNI
jgi:glycosyltransferase involved in cell wall biosynthesis